MAKKTSKFHLANEAYREYLRTLRGSFKLSLLDFSVSLSTSVDSSLDEPIKSLILHSSLFSSFMLVSAPGDNICLHVLDYVIHLVRDKKSLIGVYWSKNGKM